MTFKEKLQMEHPECVDENCGGGCRNCPYTYGYEKYADKPCEMIETSNDFDCKKCWNREMPGTETSEKEFDIATKGYSKGYSVGRDDGYVQGLNDAWELAKKCVHLEGCGEDNELMYKIFNTVFIKQLFDDNTPQEALAKLKAYEENKVLIRGDEVICLDTDEKAIYWGRSEGSEEGWFLMKEYDVPQRIMLNTVKKTGKHIDCLEQIGE